MKTFKWHVVSILHGGQRVIHTPWVRKKRAKQLAEILNKIEEDVLVVNPDFQKRTFVAVKENHYATFED
jgi:Icc-related predicted phosphoesterase